MALPSVGEAALKYLSESNFEPLSSSSSSSSAGSLFSSDTESESSRVRRRPRLSNLGIGLSACSDRDFYAHFHITKTLAHRLIQRFSKSDIVPMHLHGKEKIPHDKTFLVGLWYLSNNEPFRAVSRLFNLSYSSAWRCIKRVVSHILTLAPEVVKWPNKQRAEEIARGFKMKGKCFDNAIGSIDISHIVIRKPNKQHDQYHCGNGLYSLILMAVCDHESKFIYLSCGEPGTRHPSIVLKLCDLYGRVSENPDTVGDNYLLGPNYFPNLHWLVTQHDGVSDDNISKANIVVNSNLETARSVTGLAFETLKGRFCRLRKLDNIDLQFVSEIVLASCVLHNICLDDGDIWPVETGDFNQSQSHMQPFSEAHILSGIKPDPRKKLDIISKISV